jgi:hypothetical protein
MQDRIYRIVEIFLHRAAGPYMWVTSDKTHIEHNEFALTLTADMPADMHVRRDGPRSVVRTPLSTDAY